MLKTILPLAPPTKPALKINREIGSRLEASFNLTNLAGIARRAGNLASTHSYLLEAIDGFQLMGARMPIANWLDVSAALAVDLGRFAPAAKLWGARDTIRDEIDATQASDLEATQELYAREFLAAQQALGEKAFLKCREEGRAMTEEQAITLALEGLRS